MCVRSNLTVTDLIKHAHVVPRNRVVDIIIIIKDMCGPLLVDDGHYLAIVPSCGAVVVVPPAADTVLYRERFFPGARESVRSCHMVNISGLSLSALQNSRQGKTNASCRSTYVSKCYTS